MSEPPQAASALKPRRARRKIPIRRRVVPPAGYRQKSRVVKVLLEEEGARSRAGDVAVAAAFGIADKRRMDEVKRSFPPVVGPATRLLVLGSLPGEESLARGQYYANPRNHFWRLIGAVIGLDLVPLSYEARLEALLAAGIGLWDTVGSARRRGSLDGAIRDHSANDLAALADRLPRLRAVAFNGARSASLGLPQLAGRPDLALVPLPSSSPAYTLPFDVKLAAWKRLADHL